MQILYQDESIIAVNKPNGMFVHRTKLDPNADEFVVQVVRDLIEQWVYPAHRLDRKTSGVLLLAKDQSVQSKLNTDFSNRLIKKTYLAIVRGYTEDSGRIDYPLLSENGKLQDAITIYKTISRSEINISSGRFATSRYSLVEINPETGRMHQIRRHLSHIFHPIIGDRPHGCNKQNKFFLEQFLMDTMLLHAVSLDFSHPVSGLPIKIDAELMPEFQRMLAELGLHL